MITIATYRCCWTSHDDVTIEPLDFLNSECAYYLCTLRLLNHSLSTHLPIDSLTHLPTHSLSTLHGFLTGLSSGLTLCPSKPEERKYCFSSTDKDESASLMMFLLLAIVTNNSIIVVTRLSWFTDIIALHSISTSWEQSRVSEWVREWVCEWVSG